MPRILGFSTYSENFQGGDITDEEWAFLKAVAAYQKRWNRRYPSWREILHVLKCVGYRKVAPPIPVETAPLTLAEKKLAAEAEEQVARSPAVPSHPAG